MAKKRSDLSRYLTGDDAKTRKNGYGVEKRRVKPRGKRGGSRA